MTTDQKTAFNVCQAATDAFEAAEKKLQAAQAVYAVAAAALSKAKEDLYASMYNKA